ncbi:hypothetical protein [Cytobacillus sp. FSL H8-0458]|uniref:hypothetical protein n=1 Tax=Cytobacillus sp. FSL H8-0458 TaxID=2975346 RepID=UPI0030F79D4E
MKNSHFVESAAKIMIEKGWFDCLPITIPTSTFSNKNDQPAANGLIYLQDLRFYLQIKRSICRFGLSICRSNYLFAD